MNVIDDDDDDDDDVTKPPILPNYEVRYVATNTNHLSPLPAIGSVCLIWSKNTLKLQFVECTV